MPRLPPFIALRALEAAARRRSYSRAAEELSVTHSAVSQHIRGLEAELGARLFERRGNRMEPSPAALLLAQEVAHALQVLREAVTVAAEEAADSEPLVISIGGFMAYRWLPPRLPRLLAHPAGARLQIRTENRNVDLYREPVDVGMRYGTGDWGELASHPLFHENIFPVCAPSLAAKLRLSCPRDLLTAPLITRSTQPWSTWFSHFGLEAPAEQGPAFDDPVMMLRAAAQGIGVALGDDSLASEGLASGELVLPFENCAVSGTSLYMVWLPNNRKLARIHALRDWLLAEIEAERADLSA
ncbi:MAG TPA: LysR substrate-binding domain-containing protein [Phenylobacterium sp.]